MFHILIKRYNYFQHFNGLSVYVFIYLFIHDFGSVGRPYNERSMKLKGFWSDKPKMLVSIS